MLSSAPQVLNGVSLIITLLVLMGGGLSCQGSIYGLDDTLTPLAELKLSVRAEEVAALPEEVRKRLRVGLVWLDINIPSEWCAEQLSAQLLGEESGEESGGEESGGEESGGEESGGEESGGEESGEEGPSLDIVELNQLLALCRDPLGVAPALAGA